MFRYGFLSGTDANPPPDSALAPSPSEVEIVRRRESKWLDMLAHWDGYMMKNYKKVRERCRKGIPSSVRARAWMHLCGAHYHMDNPQNKTEFRRLYVSIYKSHSAFLVVQFAIVINSY